MVHRSHPPMSKRNNESQKTALALAMAGGINVGEWARQNEVNKRTAYTWSRSDEVRDKIADIRRRAVDRAVGRLSRNATAASMIIIKLARKATSEAVKLQAARAILADLMVVSNYAAIEQRLAEVERRLQDSSQLPVAGSQLPVPGPQPDQTPTPV
jgi:hypothetical protein